MTAVIDEDRLYGMAEAAEALGLTVATLPPELTLYRIGNRPVVRGGDLDRYVARKA